MRSRMVTISKVSIRGGLTVNNLQNNIENTTVSAYSLGDLKWFLLKRENRGDHGRIGLCW